MSNLLIPTNTTSGTSEMAPASVTTLANAMLAALDLVHPSMTGTWNLQIDPTGGIVTVRNVLISGKMGFTMHIKRIDPEMRVIRYLAGELLERFGISREKHIDVTDQIGGMTRTLSGEAKYDD